MKKILMSVTVILATVAAPAALAQSPLPQPSPRANLSDGIQLDGKVAKFTAYCEKSINAPKSVSSDAPSDGSRPVARPNGGRNGS